MTDLPSPAEILHGRPAQGAVLQRHPKHLNMKQIHQRLIEIQNSQKENFDRSHRAKDLCVLKVNEKVRFFPNKQGTNQTTWLTGTVSEILDCGNSYTITGPNGRVYRRNRAYLKLICYDGSTFQAHTTAKQEKKPKFDSFPDPKLPEKKKTMLFQTDTADVMARAIIFDKQDEHPSHSPYHLFHPGKAQWNPMQRHPHKKAGRDTSLSQPSSDPKTLTTDLHHNFQHY